jgi:hypothetical protein
VLHLRTTGYLGANPSAFLPHRIQARVPVPLFPLLASLFDFASLPCARHSPGSSPWVNSVANQILIRCRTEPDPVAIALQVNKSVSKHTPHCRKAPGEQAATAAHAFWMNGISKTKTRFIHGTCSL